MISPLTTSGPGHHVDPQTMRRAMGHFATGVAIVTTMTSEGDPCGMTVNSLTSVSLEPPQLLVCFTIGARTADSAIESGRFAVSILAARQEPLARRFAGRGEDHFAGLQLTYGEHDVPVVPDAMAHLECIVDQYVPAGDHLIVVGGVHRSCVRDGQPLAFFNGRFADVTDRGHEAIPWFF